MKIINEFELEEMIKLQKDYSMNFRDISDEKLKKYLSFYDFLNKNSEKLISKENIRSIIYSKYYWYNMYKKRYFEVVGYDAGIEQEGFKLIQEIENELQEGVDWSIIQEIEESVN